MSWFWLAVVGHMANGAAFLIDKMLLTSAFKRSATYAGLVGVLSFLVVLAAPFVQTWPSGIVLLLGCSSGVTFVFALWAFFAAMARAEASRVVPIVGSLIPIFTLAGSFLFLNERLTDRAFLGFFLLIFATILLSGGGSKQSRLTSATLWLAVGSAILFAIASVTGKATYTAVGFLGGFLTTRLSAAFAALSILALFDRAAGREVLSMIGIGKEKTRKGKGSMGPTASAAGLAIIGQLIGAIGFVLVQWGTSRGSASIVNSLQAVQYALLVVVALLLRKDAHRILGEELSRSVLTRKFLALAITAGGLALLV